MSDKLVCYRCGASLAALSLPFSRYDECPSCTRPLRVCRMCNYFAPEVPKQCREDDAEEEDRWHRKKARHPVGCGTRGI